MQVRRLFAIVTALGLMASGPVHANSLFDYGARLSDSFVVVDGHKFRIYVHRSRDTLLLQPSLGSEIGANPSKWPLSIWRSAAEAFVGPAGCGISDVMALSRIGASWEAKYVCPANVDLRTLVRAQHRALERGEPIQP